MAPEAEVLLEAEARDDEVAAVAAAFAEAGIDAHVRIDPDCKGAGGEFPWMVAISLPATAFFTAVAAKAGEDAYRGLKKLVRRLYDARKASKFRTGRVVLMDIDSGRSFTLPPEPSDEAWHQLSTAGPDDFAASVFRWDRETGEWQEIRYE